MTETMGRMSWPGNTRWLWPLLLGSLALNLLAFGTMLGQKLRPQATSLPPGIAARLAQDAAAPLVKDLSETKKVQVRAIFEAHRGQNRALWLAVRERRADVAKVLDAESFDQAAYVAAMTRLIDTEAKARTASQPTFAEVAAVLSAKERQDFLTTHRQLRQQLVGSQREGRRDRPADGTGTSGGRP